MQGWRALWEDARRGAAALGALVWPGPCLLCRADLPPGATACVCEDCWSTLPARRGDGCPRCDLPATAFRRGICPDCRGEARAAPLAQTVAALVYEGDAVTLHRLLKFGGALDLVPPLAARMARAWIERARESADLVVAVPPDPLRWSARRGVPRALARALAPQLGLPCARRGLVKRRPTRSQTGRGARERREALAGAFRALPAEVSGAAVLVVDDVSTTGTTLREAARALADGGARRVAGLVLARALPDMAHRPGRG